MSFKILTLNNIAVEGLRHLPRELYEVASEIGHPDGILVRSANMHDMEIPESVMAIARAGAGVNNIPVDALTKRGIPVFNAPGANANAVKELVIAGLLLGARNICQAWRYVLDLEGSDAEIGKLVEAGKKRYVGFELPGKTLGVIGLGKIGMAVASRARALDMEVVGYDPFVTEDAAGLHGIRLLSVLLGTPIAVFGAIGGLFIARLFDESYVNNVFAQIGLVMLIGLSAKNAILIVEFAKVESEKGRDAVDAAMEAARLRFRPILMTAFSFILGVLPLVIAEGAGANGRRAMGTTVFFGMLAATVVGILLLVAGAALAAILACVLAWGGVIALFVS